VTTTDVAAAAEVEADLLIREAHEAGYRFPPGFSGFAAGLRYRAAGIEAGGEVVIRAGTRPELRIDLPSGEERWLAHELSSMAGHRFHRAYEDTDGPTSKVAEPDDGNPLGRLVRLDDSMRSTYRVGAGLINEISREHAGSRFTIVIQQRAEAPDGRVVSAAFTVCHWEGDGALRRADAYTDSYVERAGVFLPAGRRVATANEEGLFVRELELVGHDLLASGRAR
jgi:Protein of unknown function (DUF3386)